MALKLHIVGPDLDVQRLLRAHAPELVMGRDSDCAICLPDPHRNVSRRHLALWNEDDVLHFRVLSVVNGVTMPFGDAPPGAKGVLLPGQAFTLAEYTVEVEQDLLAANADLAVQAEAVDPWSVFEREPSGIALQPTVSAQEDDPFGEWGFEGHAAPIEHTVTDAHATPEIAALLRGLGLDPSKVGALSVGEMEAIGQLVRRAVLGVLELYAVAKGVKQDFHAEDRTMLAAKDSNPLSSDWPEDVKLQYLFGGRASGAGFVSPQRAMEGLLQELMAHESAVSVAARAVVDGTLREYSPDAIRTRLLGGGAKLFEGARAWEAFGKEYAQQSESQPERVQRLFDKYFADAYLREAARVEREAVQRARRVQDGFER